MPIHQNQWPFPIRAGTTAETGIKVPTCWGFIVINTGTRFYVWSISANDDNGNPFFFFFSFFFFFLYIILFSTSLSLAGNPGPLTWVIKAQQPQEQRYPFLSVCLVGYLSVSKRLRGCQCLDFWRAHRCWCVRLRTGAVRTPYWKLTLGEKSLAALGIRTRVGIAPGFSFGRSTSWATTIPAPSRIHTDGHSLYRFCGGVAYHRHKNKAISIWDFRIINTVGTRS